MSFTQASDLTAAGVSIPNDKSEFRLTTAQAGLVFTQARERSGASIDTPRFGQLAIFLKEVSDPVVLRARTENGHPKPFVVTVYELGQDGRLDRSRDYFYFCMKESNKSLETRTTSGPVSA